jgi:hypothetical protein
LLIGLKALTVIDRSPVELVGKWMAWRRITFFPCFYQTSDRIAYRGQEVEYSGCQAPEMKKALRRATCTLATLQMKKR